MTLRGRRSHAAVLSLTLSALLVAAGSAAAATNLALNKPSTASSIWSASYDAPKSVDGNDTTRWSAVSGQTANQWVRIDLGAGASYDRVVVKEISYPRVTSHKLQSSTDGTNFTDIAGTTGTTIGAAKTITFTAVAARYVRLYMMAASGVPTINTIEVYLDGAPTPTPTPTNTPTPTPTPTNTPTPTPTPTPGGSSCSTGANNVWTNSTVVWQSGTFTAEFDATPSLSPMDGVMGFTLAPQAAYTGLAAYVRFNTTGQIDARNGAAFAAASTVNYAAGTSYHFKLVINVPAHTYSIYVTPAGGSQVTIGTNYAFRVEQNTVPRLDNMTTYVKSTPGGTVEICNVTVKPSCTIPSTSPLFNQFKTAKQNGTEPNLPDFSYAGYHRTEKAIPHKTGPIFNVTSYGAIANDAGFDDAGIQAAIDAAEAAGGGVVLFPAGQFKVGPNEDPLQFITVEGSNIVLRGAGDGTGGTEILMVNMKNGTAMFEIGKPSASYTGVTIANIVQNATRQTFSVTVDDSSQMSVGQWVIIKYQATEYNNFYFNGMALDPDWLRVVDNGVGVHEVHQVASISGNVVTFKEPLQFTIVMGATPWRIESSFPLEEVGVEDIKFSGSWNTYPETFVHHQDWIHDSAWRLMSMERVVNSWVRRSTFNNFNIGCTADNASFTTFEDLAFTGKKGHTSVGQRRGYGLLVRDTSDPADTHHGPDAGYNAVATVYLRMTMNPDASLDFHGGVPHGILVDDSLGGEMKGSGGPLDNYPHTGRYTVLWNFFLQTTSGTYSYDMWDNVNRDSHTYTLPYFVGFRANASITFQNPTTELAANESQGTAVTPKSLFEAQLALRTCQ